LYYSEFNDNGHIGKSLKLQEPVTGESSLGLIICLM